MAEIVTSQADATQRATDPRDRLLRLGTAYVNYGLDHRHAFALIFDPEVSPPRHPPPELASLVNQHTGLLRGAVEDGLQADPFPSQTPPDDIATALWTQAHGLTQLVVLGHVERSRVVDVLGVSVILERD